MSEQGERWPDCFACGDPFEEHGDGEDGGPCRVVKWPDVECIDCECEQYVVPFALARADHAAAARAEATEAREANLHAHYRGEMECSGIDGLLCWGCSLRATDAALREAVEGYKKLLAVTIEAIAEATDGVIAPTQVNKNDVLRFMQGGAQIYLDRIAALTPPALQSDAKGGA